MQPRQRRLECVSRHLRQAASAQPTAAAAAATVAAAAAAAAAAAPPAPFSADRLRGALVGMFIGDALAVPAHWYYNRDELVDDYGELRGYTQVRETMPGSFLVRMTYDAAPGSRADILHSEGQKYGAGKRWHFHPGLRPGDNTLNLHLVRVLLRSVAADGGLADADRFMAQYEEFMLTPGSHTDSWADNCLKMSFQRYADAGEAKPLRACAIDEAMVWNVNNTSPYLRSLPLAALLMARRGLSEGAAAEEVKQHEHLTHITHTLDRYRPQLIELFVALLQRADDGNGDDAASATAASVLSAAAQIGMPTLTGEEQRSRYARMHGQNENTVPPLPERANDSMSPEERKVFHSSKSAEDAPLAAALEEWVALRLPAKDVVTPVPNRLGRHSARRCWTTPTPAETVQTVAHCLAACAAQRVVTTRSRAIWSMA
jgi:hypothetical protein